MNYRHITAWHFFRVPSVFKWGLNPPVRLVSHVKSRYAHSFSSDCHSAGSSRSNDTHEGAETDSGAVSSSNTDSRIPGDCSIPDHLRVNLTRESY
ncbi:hypothetical protein BaRGS_00004411 [Batillaria attramentaria]|uniref:Uncharacterized protein n=1 Tax=Batillaria attramentaria TaxID=370345 RepID=A0ABD0LX70_9CAEN